MYRKVGTPRVATMKAPVVPQGIVGANEVPVSSMVRERFFLSKPYLAYRGPSTDPSTET